MSHNQCRESWGFERMEGVGGSKISKFQVQQKEKSLLTLYVPVIVGLCLGDGGPRGWRGRRRRGWGGEG